MKVIDPLYLALKTSPDESIGNHDRSQLMELEKLDSSMLISRVSFQKDSTSWQENHNLKSFSLPMLTKQGFVVPFL